MSINTLERPSEIIPETATDLIDQLGLEPLSPYLPGFRTSSASKEIGDFDKLDREAQLRCIARSCIGASQEVAEQALNELGLFVGSDEESVEFDFLGYNSLYADALFRRGCVETICGNLSLRGIEVDKSLEDYAEALFADHSVKSYRQAQLGPILLHYKRMFVGDIPVHSSYKLARD